MRIAIGLILLLSLVGCTTSQKKHEVCYSLCTVEFPDVEMQDSFWSQRITTNRTVTLPYNLEYPQFKGFITDFKIAAGIDTGSFHGNPYGYADSEVYKTIEGASYILMTDPDETLELYLDTIISYIAAAQMDNGFIHTSDQVKEPGKENYLDPSNMYYNHRQYNLGHLYEGAVAHYYATGKRDFLDVAIKNADMMCETFRPGKNNGVVSGHQEIKIGLIKLYKITGDRKYLDLAKFLLDERGKERIVNKDQMFRQNHLPVLEQKEAVGHAVRALYMYISMADIGACLNDERYFTTLDTLWENLYNKKMYLTGGLGVHHKMLREDGRLAGWEGFGENYELPNDGYCETCASMASVLLNHRLFLRFADAKYIDIIERTLYNGFLSGISLGGTENFYENDLVSTGCDNRQCYRKGWWGSCCPNGIIRFIPQIPGFFYATIGDTLFVNLYGSNSANVDLQGNNLSLTQDTEYPWDGNIRIRVDPEQKGDFTIKIRIPGWVREKPVPGDLYHYLDLHGEKYSIRVNGEEMYILPDKGYSAITRVWDKGDVIEIDFPMEIRRVVANNRVKEDSNKVAIERGPVVFCAEGVDNDGSVLDLVLPDQSVLDATWKSGLLKGVIMVEGEAKRKNDTRTFPFNAIPYYARAHRGKSEMLVWYSRN